MCWSGSGSAGSPGRWPVSSRRAEERCAPGKKRIQSMCGVAGWSREDSFSSRIDTSHAAVWSTAKRQRSLPVEVTLGWTRLSFKQESQGLLAPSDQELIDENLYVAVGPPALLEPVEERLN